MGTFGPGETQKMVTLEVLDDDVFEEDEHFYIRISNLRRKDGMPFGQIDVVGDDGKTSMQPTCQLGTPHMATIMILDDDHSGIFGFENVEAEIVESVGAFELKAQRISGARGKVAIPFNTEDGTAKDGAHYEAQEGEIIFENEENEKILSIVITDEESYEKNLIMYVNIGEPRQIAEGKEGEGIDYSILDAKDPEDLTEEEKIALLGRPCLGANTRIQIRIKESKEFKGSVDKMMQKANNSMITGSSSWLEQFTDALTVQVDDDEEEGEEDEEAEEKVPSMSDYIMHFLTLPWKLIFALIPPTSIYNGYPTFVIAILFIGLCTAVIGDVAGHLGCFINLKDCVNAIAFVALGTSVPDTFASKTAAIEDETADASVGNVTGSNAVNVFLGIGIAWTMAAIYWEAQGEIFMVEPGSLGFSVTIFCIEALLAILILMLRRSPVVGGELGGKTFQDHFILHLCLLLVFLRCNFCSGGLRSNQAWVLRRNDAWLVSSEPLCGVKTLCRDNKRFKNTKKFCPAPSKRRLQNLQSEPQYGTLDLQLSPLLRPKNIQKSGQVSQVLEMVEESSGYKMCPVPRFTCHVSRVSLLLLFHCYFLQY